MLDFIPGWECLTNSKSIKNGTPSQYVAFAIPGYINSTFDDGDLTAIATIGQRDEKGRLFQNSLHSRHFLPRKFTITVDNAAAQIQSLNQLVDGLNDGSIDPEHIPGKINSAKKWAALMALLKASK